MLKEAHEKQILLLDLLPPSAAEAATPVCTVIFQKWLQMDNESQAQK